MRARTSAWLPSVLCLLVVGCSGGTSPGPGGSSGTATTGSTAVEGTWDITSYGSDSLAPSSVTVTGGNLTGTLSFAGSAAGCSRTLAFAIQGNSMTGSSTPAGTCAGGKTATLTGTRTTPQPDSDTPWNGTWTLQEGGSSSKGELTIAGLSVSSGNFSMSVAGGMATGSGSTRYTFAARRR